MLLGLGLLAVQVPAVPSTLMQDCHKAADQTCCFTPCLEHCTPHRCQHNHHQLHHRQLLTALPTLPPATGGERSYTTVSFILALGHWTESPWRAMDEYDVYMDAINRRVSTETLLEFALDNADLQFIFLTPQVGGSCVCVWWPARLQCTQS